MPRLAIIAVVAVGLTAVEAKSQSLIFAQTNKRGVVIAYYGNMSLPFDARLGTLINYDRAYAGLQRNNRLPVFFAPPGRPVMRAYRAEAMAILADWRAGKMTPLPKRTKYYKDRLGVHVP